MKLPYRYSLQLHTVGGVVLQQDPELPWSQTLDPELPWSLTPDPELQEI